MRYKIKTIIKTCDACPAQWSGKTECGKYVYIRYRHGYFRAEIDEDVVTAADTGDPLDGWMSDESMQEMTAEVFDFSAARWVESREEL